MANAIYDQNKVKVKLGVLFSDGVTLIPIKVDSSTGGFMTNTTDSVDASILNEYLAGKAVPRDANNEPAWCGVASSDATKVLPVFVDVDGAILIDQ